MDEFTKRRISLSMKGRPKNARTKMLISRALTNKVKTDEHKNLIKESMLKYWNNKKNNK